MASRHVKKNNNNNNNKKWEGEGVERGIWKNVRTSGNILATPLELGVDNLRCFQIQENDG